MATHLLIAVVLAIATATRVTAGPTGHRSQCSTQCTEQNNLAYHTGISYVYDYSVATSTGLLGSVDKTAEVHISAKAHIDVVAPCEYRLQLSSVSIEGSRRSDEFSEAVGAHSLRFSFQDGRIENICSDIQEAEWVLNFKRAVLSTFQTSITQDTMGVHTLKETDVSGICNTNFNSYTSENVQYITKTKDMASCSQRPTAPSFTSIEDIEESRESPLQNLPIISSSQICELEVDEGILKKGGCSETHKFQPFASVHGGAVTTTKTKLLLISHEPISSTASGHKFIQSSLIFTKNEFFNAKGQIEIVENILKRLEMATQNIITSEVPSLFSSLIKSLRGLKYEELSSVYNNAKKTDLLKFLIDAMPLVKTAATMEIVKDMINNFDIQDKEANVFFTSLAFINQPTSEMFTVLATLLENNPMPKAMLGISALVNNYCKINNKCIDESGIQNVVRNIEFQLGSACRTIKEEEKTAVLVALKALGNAGHMVNSKFIIQRCYTEENDMDIRIAAIEAWRHTSCDYDRSNLFAAFKDETQDTEIRIAAYLATMACPTLEIIDAINSHLTSEGVNQVTSFVWTHIVNMQESAAPGKQFIQELVNEELLQNKFKTEALKFSRNFETSTFRGDLNMGAAIESNVVFSSKSVLPRSAMLNLTVDLFGESINFFEVGGRINGFESIFEDFFGPNGYYPEDTMQNIISTLRKQQNNKEDKFEGVSEKNTDEPEGSYYLRIFGNEVLYNRFHGLNDFKKGNLFTNPFDLLIELANNGDIDYTKSYQILDNELIFPTATGLPLKLKLDGTATLALKASGSFNMQSFNNVNIEGKMFPSAAVMIDSSMSVDTPLIRSGMKMVSTLQTSTYLEGKLRIDGAKIVDVAINTPKDKMEFINVNTEFFHIEDDELIKEDLVNTIKDDTCTQGTLGMAFCKENTYITQDHRYPDVYFSGLVASKVYMKKIDTQTGYLLQYIHKPNQVHFIFDTPASTVTRNIAVSLQLKENQLSYDVITPFKSIKGKGEIEWQAKNRKIMISSTIDGKEYTMQGGITTNENSEIKTELKIESPEKVIFDTSVTGKIVVDQYFLSQLEVNYIFMNSIKNSFKHSSFLKKEVNSDSSKYDFHFELESSQYSILNLGLDWQIDMTPEHFDNQLKVQYGPAVCNVNLMYENDNRNNDLKRKVDFELSCPYYNLKNEGTFRYVVQPNNFQYEIILNSGGTKINQMFNLSYESGAKLKGEAQMDLFINDIVHISKSMSIDMKIVEEGHYTIQMKQNIFKETEMEGTLIDKSSPENIEIDIMGSFKVDENAIMYKSTISANAEVANVDLNMEHNGSKYYATAQGTHSSLLLDSNILQHIVLHADIIPSGETRRFNLSAEWNKDVDPTAILMVNSEFSKNLIKAGLKYSMREVSILVHKTDTGLELATSWSPKEKVAAKVIYSLDNVKSFTIIFNTPFKGYESQIFDIMFSLLKDEVKASFSATWRKSKLLLFTLNTKVHNGLHSNMLKSNINFSSTFENFALLNLSLNHEMNSNSVLSEVNGEWNDQKINGKIDFKAQKTGAEFIVAFDSPFTKEFMIDMSSSIEQQNLSLVLKGQYGLRNSNISIKGYKKNNNNLSIILTVDTPYQAIPKIFSDIRYSFDGIKNVLFADSKINDKKYVMKINTSKIIKDLSFNITGDINLITPLSHPITITFDHRQDDKIFKTNFVTTRFWSNNDTIEGNIEGKFISGNYMHLSVRIAHPDIQIVSEMNHRFHDKHLNSNIDLTINEKHVSLQAKGIIDVSSHRSDVIITLETPFNKIFELNAKYNLVKLDELFSLSIISGHNVYGLSFGGNIIKDGGAIYLSLKTPIKEWHDIKFNFEIDFSTINKTFAVMLEKDGNVRAISITGEVLGDMDLKIQLPDIGMQNLNLFLGKSDRNKRSIESNWLTDDYLPLDKLNSVKVNLKSDYPALSEFYAEWLHDDEYANTITFKNKDQNLNMVLKEGSRKSWDFEMDGQYESTWLIRRLFGYISASEFQSYLQGQAHDGQSTIKAKGNFGPKRGTFTMEINSPYNDYKKVDAKFDYNLATRSLSFNAKSSSSNFMMDFKLKGIKIKIDFIIPRSDQDIVMNLDVSPFEGKIHWESPFAAKSWNYYHKVMIGKTSSMKINTKLNELDQFSLNYSKIKNKKSSSFHMELKGNINYVIKYDRNAWEEITASLKINENELKVIMNGSGNLPQQGKFDVVISMNVLNLERTVSLQAYMDRSSEEKSLKLEMESEEGKMYIFDLQGVLSLKNLKVGQYKLDITTPHKIKSSLLNTGAKWDLTKDDGSEVDITLGSVTYTLKGQFGRTESNLTISSNKPGTSDMFLQWKRNSVHPNYDSYFKIGPKKNYLMYKWKGYIQAGNSGNIEGGIRVPMLMKHEFNFNAEWETNSSGVSTGGGTFQYGGKSGEHVIKNMSYDVVSKKGTIHVEATSNIPKFSNVVWKGEYDGDNKWYVDHKIEWDTNNLRVKFDTADFTSKVAKNTGLIHTPMWGDIEFIYNHDFRNNMAKSVEWVAKMKGKEASVISTWGYSDNFEVLKGEVKIVGPLAGDIQIKWDIDSKISDSKSEIYYKRNNDKNLSIQWSRKVSDNVIRRDFLFESHFKMLKSFKFFMESDFTEGIDIELVLDWGKQLTFNLLLDPSKLNMKFTTPFSGFEKAEGLINYDIAGKTKTIKAHYERGDRMIDFNMKLEIPNSNEGSVSITASSPFPFAKNVDLNATWKNGKGEVSYTRNDVTLTFSGDAVVTSDGVSFDLAFIPSNQDPIKLGATYNLANILDGNTDTLETLARIDFEIDGYKSKNELKGFRNKQRVYVVMDATSNIPGLREFKFQIDTPFDELRTRVKFLFNEFNLEIDSLYETRPNGFYIRSQTYSSYMLFSGLITGIGIEDGQTIFTLGYGDISEVVLYVKPKETWAKGFSGKIDLPKQNLNNIMFDATYILNSDNEVMILFEIDEQGRKSNFEIIINADDLRVAFNSHWQKRSIRMQRSITNEGFTAETSIDGYGIMISKRFSDETRKKGIRIEGEVFGERILIDTLFQTDENEYAEGKMIIEMPFVPKVGGIFNWTNKDNKILTQIEIHLPSSFTPRISCEAILDLNEGINGFATFSIHEQEYTITFNISGSDNMYEASMTIVTPIHTFRTFNVNGQLEMGSFDNIDLKINIESPTTTNDLTFSYKIDQSEIKTNAFISSSMLSNQYKVSFILSNLSIKHTKFELIVNNEKFNLDYSIEKKIFVESDHYSTDEIKLNVNAIINDEKHDFNTLFNVNINHIHGYLELTSEIFNGNQKINFDITNPMAQFHSFALDISLGTLETKSFHFDYDANNGLELNMSLDNLDVSQLAVQVLCSHSTVYISFKLPNGNHKMSATWNTMHSLPLSFTEQIESIFTGFTAQVELSSTLLSHDYLLKSILSNGILNKDIDFQLIIGSNIHSLIGNISTTETSSEASLRVNSTFLSFKEALVKYIVIPENRIEIIISSTFGKIMNQFNMKIDQQNGKFVAAVDSPLISTGFAKAEASLTGDIENGMELNMSLKNSEDIISCTLNLQMPNHVMLKVNTPFTGYRNMIFGAKYNTGKTNTISLFAEKPIKINLDIELGNINMLYQTHIKLRTPIENLEIMEAQIFIPINKFAPIIMLNVNGQKYGIDMKVEQTMYNKKLFGTVMTGDNIYSVESIMKRKAPFVFAYKVEAKPRDAMLFADTFTKSFHIRMDSSSFNIFRTQNPIVHFLFGETFEC